MRVIANHRQVEKPHWFESNTFLHGEDAAKWSATGLENRGAVTRRGSIPPSSSSKQI